MNRHLPLWRALVSNGATPVGLGARDTLRLEKGYLLSGVDFCSPDVGPRRRRWIFLRDSWETNVPFGLDLEHDFIGKHRVSATSKPTSDGGGSSTPRKVPPRPGKAVQSVDGQPLGRLSSGAPSPSLGNIGIGLGYIAGVSEGDEVMVVASPRKSVRAVVVRPPFY